MAWPLEYERRPDAPVLPTRRTVLGTISIACGVAAVVVAQMHRLVGHYAWTRDEQRTHDAWLIVLPFIAATSAFVGLFVKRERRWLVVVALTFGLLLLVTLSLSRLILWNYS